MRDAVLADLTTALLRATAPRPRLVAVDGVDGAGKTVFADAWAAYLTARGTPVVRVGVDGFHRPRDQRYRQGRDSPRGFLEDSYDDAALLSAVIDPVRRPEPPGAVRQVRTAVFDHRADAPVERGPVDVPPDAVVLVDGIFLHRDELTASWDHSVFLRCSFVSTFTRMALRDGSPPDPDDRANRRYLEGQRLYLRRCEPERRATVVVDNEDVARPRIVRAAGPGRS